MNGPGTRVGLGYDVHRLTPGRRLVLGGVEIDGALGLAGHSDADVLLHAVMDALLGAAGLSDIGHYFPPDDDRFRDASSLELLRQVTDMIHADGWRVGNLDATLIAEQPRLAPYMPQMKRLVSATLGISEARIGIKATTNEGLGALGRGEGIAAFAVALLFGEDGGQLEDRVGT